MKQRLLIATLLAGLLTPTLASANPEPTAYDTRSIAMGLTGTSYMERPAALAINPALLEGIPKLGFTFNFTNLLVNQTAPVQGAGTSLSSGIGYGPLPSGFIAGRIAPRVVFSGGIYIETGYGSSFSNVTCLDGVAVDTDGNIIPGGDCTNNEPQDLNVTFFVGEFASGSALRFASPSRNRWRTFIKTSARRSGARNTDGSRTTSGASVIRRSGLASR